MEMILTRTHKAKTFTEGHLEVDGVNFCDTLEPTWRDVGWGRPGRTVPGRTAIPDGRYPLAVTYSPRFEAWLPLVFHVPGFTDIRIHAGSTVADTMGDILVGLNVKPGLLLDSHLWLHRLVKRLAKRPEGEGVWLTVQHDF